MTARSDIRHAERLAERTRVARDLHDTLLQSFQGLMLRLQVVDDMLPQGKAKQELEQTLERADQAIAEGRSAVYGLRSSVITANDMAQALSTLGEELATPDGAAFRLVVEGPSRELRPIVRDELYRITREALRNAFSHARARHIEAELIYAEKCSGCEFGMTERAFFRQFWKRAARAITACLECASAPHKSVRSWPSGAAWGPGRRSN